MSICGTVAVGSTNPVKIDAAADGLRALGFDIDAVGIDVPSGVDAQPVGDEVTLAGATHRAEAVRAASDDAVLAVGIEGGVVWRGDLLDAMAWVVMIDGEGKVGSARTATFTLPPKVTELVADGVELGEADDIVFGRRDSKRQNGAVGLLSGDAIGRRAYYAHAVTLAALRWRQPELW
ncbi:MAG: inosine/xanthosine triphosphatase [Planctomycetota bacterium]